MDAERLDALAAQLGETPSGIARTLRVELEHALEQIDTGLRAGDTAAVGRAVHGARNSVLMLDDTPMLAALRALDEAVAAGGEAAGARAALADEWRRLDAALRAAGG